MKFIKNFFRDQLIDYRPTTPQYRWSDGKQAYFIVSEAGVVEYRVKDVKDNSTFRNNFINRFDTLCKRFENGEDITRDLFKFYRELRGLERVRYRANFRTRLRASLAI